MTCPHCRQSNGLMPSYDGRTCLYCGYVLYTDARPVQFALPMAATINLRADKRRVARGA